MKTKILSLLLFAVILFVLAGCDTPEPSPQQDGFAFTCNGTRITMNSDAAPVIAALGEPESYSEQPSCAFEGLDKTYFYGSFYLSTYPLEGKDYVYSIWFADDSAATEEGIRIGSKQSEVDVVYGTEHYNGTNAYALTQGDTILTIILAEGVVTSVLYETSFS